MGYKEPATREPESLLYSFYSLLQKTHFKPAHIVDVGANHGNWTRTSLRFFPDAYYTLLEPQEWLRASVQDLLDKNKKIQFYPLGAGSQPGSFSFTVVNRDDSSSFRFSREEADKYGFQQIDIPVVTLNEFIRKLDLPAPDIIKIDAEGLDLEVLKGASDFFGKTELFLVEAGIGSRDIDNSFLNVINFMHQQRYRLFDITDINRPFEPAVLWLTELAFIKEGGILDGLQIIQQA
jgi:FkbM family methyltransferase